MAHATEGQAREPLEGPRYLQRWSATEVLEEEGDLKAVAPGAGGRFVPLADNAHLGVMSGARHTASAGAERFVWVGPHTRVETRLDPRFTSQQQAPSDEGSIVHPSVQEWLDEPEPLRAEMDLLIRLKESPGWSVQTEVQVAALERGLGSIVTAGLRQDLMALYADEMASLQASFVAQMGEHDIQVVEQFFVTNALRAVLNKDNIDAVLQHPSVVHVMDAELPGEPESLDNWNGQDGADIVLRLDIGCNYTGWEPGMYPGWEHVASDMSYDTKKRIFLTPLDEVACWRVRLTPYGSVTSNPWESDEEVRKVYVAAGMNLFVDET